MNDNIEHSAYVNFICEIYTVYWIYIQYFHKAFSIEKMFHNIFEENILISYRKLVLTEKTLDDNDA